MTPAQQQAVDELRAVETARPGAIRILSVEEHYADVIIWVTIDCRGIEHSEGGIHVRTRERFKIRLRSGYPFQYPTVWSRHARWADAAHVQWGHYLCLLQAPEAEWNPSDGMYGFLDRLLDWLAAAAKNELDPVGAPIHPPVTYASADTAMFIPRIDTPPISTEPWLGFANLEPHGDRRYDIIGWTDLESLDATSLQDQPTAAALLVHTPMPMEYPSTVRPLFDELIKAGVSLDLLIRLVSVASSFNNQPHVHIVVGTPMRGVVGQVPRQHLACWRIGADSVARLRTSIPDPTDGSELTKARANLRDAMMQWADVATVEWCPVREARPEVTRPRDENSPVQWWKDKTVEIWGCGALGGTIAEHLCRAGVARVVLRDNARVAPGILGRQNFEDADIGTPKVDALAARLRRIRPKIDIDPQSTDLTTAPAIGDDWSTGADVLFDLTASPSVSKRLEALRGAKPAATAVVAMMVSHQARHGLVVSTRSTATGGTADAIRKAKIDASRRPALKVYRDEFWPDPPRTDLFFPEPGCSSPTFTGSAAEVEALASTMFLIATEQLTASPTSANATFISLPTGSTHRPGVSLQLRADVILKDAFYGYEVRVAASAVHELKAWARRSERLSPGTETGGVLFGERDDALKILWVSDILGPPPDSTSSSHGFECGTDGVDSAAAAIAKRSRSASMPIGMWHTHPDSAPVPSQTDFEGMTTLTARGGRSLPKQLLLIIGGTGPDHVAGAYLYDRHNETPTRSTVELQPLPETVKPDHRIGLALSGGGFRAVAFHLGVLRALHDRGVLPHIEVLSTVSGGSLIGALWAYSDDDFATFDDRVTTLLRRGLNREIARSWLFSKRTPHIVASYITSGLGNAMAAGATVARNATASLRKKARPKKVQPPTLQWANRTTAVQDVFAKQLGDSELSRPKKDVHVIINACDLRSGSAFRFGSAESGCSRYGRLSKNDVPVALAVAASAAYPVLLPAIDVNLEFANSAGEPVIERLSLSDGGVFDNMGTSCLLPDRDPRYSTNVHPVDYLIAADAGHGTLETDAHPLWWSARMKRSFESIYRKVQDTGKGLIHRHGDLDGLTGFVLPFLGQNDRALRTVIPPDLVRRADVVNYPTNFSPMPDAAIELITRRGEQLTRLMIDAHAPEIV